MSRMRFTFVSLVCIVLAFGYVGISQAAANQRLFLPLMQQKPAVNQPLHTGDITYYDANGLGNCSLDTIPGNLIGAMNKTEYANSTICGAYVEITGPKGVVVVRIVDQCPECPIGRIDLSREAFSRVANISDGLVKTTWRVVSPDLSGPIRYHFKDGSSQWWTAVQIRNHRNPIAKLEVIDTNGQFVEMTRMSYNYFILNGNNDSDRHGLGPGPYTFRVTDSYGNILTDSGIALNPDGDSTGKAQFPKP